VSMGLDLQDSALWQRQMACWARHYFLAPLQGDTLHMDDLMHPDTPQPAPFYVIKTSHTEYPYLQRAYRSCTEGGKDILKAKRFASQAAAVACAGETGITSRVVEIVKVTTALSTPAPEYAVTKAEPYAAGFFYVVARETDKGLRCYSAFGDYFAEECYPPEHHSTRRYPLWTDAVKEAKRANRMFGCHGFTYAVYRVEPKTPTAPSIEKVVNIASL
jgi:hypothetical protein